MNLGGHALQKFGLAFLSLFVGVETERVFTIFREERVNCVEVLDSSSKLQSPKRASAGIISNINPRRKPFFSGYDPLILIVSAKKSNFFTWNESSFRMGIVWSLTTKSFVDDGDRREFSLWWMVGTFNPRMKSSPVWPDGSTIRAV
jgi:hypothetical protein